MSARPRSWGVSIDMLAVSCLLLLVTKVRQGASTCAEPMRIGGANARGA
jgi:hypothetical protein